MPTHTKKASTTYRLSDDCRAMIRDIAGWYGLSDTAVMEAAVRIMHRRGPLTATEGEVQAVLPAEAPPVKPARRARARKAD